MYRLHPIETYSTNVMGTVHLLEAVRFCSSIKSCIIVTTDKCYENKEWSWGYRETDRLGGHDPYSNSKACTELVVSAEDRLIPDVYRAILNGTELSIRYPNSTRPWQHVLAPLSGYNEDCISVGEIIKKTSYHWGKELPVKLESNVQLHEAKFLKLDISKAYSLL